MNLPDERLLQDAEWQVDYATQQLKTFIDDLQAKTAVPPADPKARESYNKTVAFLGTLEFFFECNTTLINLLRDREAQMGQEMANAQFRYNQMGVDRDYYRLQAQATQKRYYVEVDTLQQVRTQLGLS